MLGSIPTMETDLPFRRGKKRSGHATAAWPIGEVTAGCMTAFEAAGESKPESKSSPMQTCVGNIWTLAMDHSAGPEITP
jgi:hypothetical protein